MNGYTGIFENENVTFAQYLWRCARAFGPLIHMRDENFDTPIRLPKLDNYYQKRLEDARKELVRYENMSLVPLQKTIDSDYEKRQQEAKEHIAKAKKLQIRLESMMMQIETWTPPTPRYEELKQFMMGGIRYSLENDVNIKYWEDVLALPKQTAEEYLQENIKYAKEDVERYTRRIAEEKEHVEQQTEWITTLMASVPVPKE